MKLKLVSKKEDEKLQIEIKDAGHAYVNTIRRLCMNEVPAMAIEDVELRKNDSGLYDEIVAHRLGLVALKTDLKSYDLATDCKCKGEGCAKCQLKLTIKVKGPGTVYAKDIVSKDPKVIPVFPETPIVKLLDDQELECEMTAVLGKGKDHVKWSPCLAYYNQEEDLEVEDKEAKEKDQYTLTIEPWGQLSAKDVVLKAIEMYDKQLDEFNKLFK
jgi:DNA-directed RNA polymerase subunit D